MLHRRRWWRHRGPAAHRPGLRQVLRSFERSAAGVSRLAAHVNNKRLDLSEAELASVGLAQVPGGLLQRTNGRVNE